MHLRRTACALVAITLILSGCGVSGGGSSDGSLGAATGAEPAAKGAEGVLADLRGSVALIDTPIASGSAVLLEDGYLVTNAHVVDPFDVVDVTFEGEDAEWDVPVVGVDLTTDIAVVGPVATDHEPVALEDPADLDQGSDLFLVGFPGDQEDPEVTISRGVLSRTREAKGWDLSFLQSDTKIAPGQSGGALADDGGRVVGISGLSDDDGYALTLSGADAAASVEAILAGDGSDWDPLPTEAEDLTATFEVAGSTDHRTLLLPAADEDRSLVVALEGEAAAVELDDVGFYPLALNQAAYDLSGGEDADLDVGLPEPTAPGADGRYTFELDAGFPALLLVGAAVDGPTSVTVTTSEPFAVVAGDPAPRAIEVGAEPVTTTLGSLDPTVVFTVDLAADEEIDVLARSAVGDVAFAIVGPGDALDDVEEFDDGGGGLFDLDAEATYTARTAGPHQIWLYQVEGAATEARLAVEAA